MKTILIFILLLFLNAIYANERLDQIIEKTDLRNVTQTKRSDGVKFIEFIFRNKKDIYHIFYAEGNYGFFTRKIKPSDNAGPIHIFDVIEPFHKQKSITPSKAELNAFHSALKKWLTGNYKKEELSILRYKKYKSNSDTTAVNILNYFYRIKTLQLVSEGKAKKHIVKKGETLFSIAKQYYGNGNNWKKVLDFNKDRLGKGTFIRENEVILIQNKPYEQNND